MECRFCFIFTSPENAVLMNWLLCWYSLCIVPLYDEKGQAYHEHTKVCEVVTGAGDVILTVIPQGFTTIAAIFW